MQSCLPTWQPFYSGSVSTVTVSYSTYPFPSALRAVRRGFLLGALPDQLSSALRASDRVNSHRVDHYATFTYDRARLCVLIGLRELNPQPIAINAIALPI